MDRLSKRLLLAVPLLLLQGCFVPISYQAAIPELPAGASGEIQKNIIEIELPELTLATQVQAFDWDGSYLPPPLGVWLVFEPLKGPLTLRTSQVTLRVDNNAEMTAISYLGPDVKWFSPRALAAGCGPRFYRTGIGITRNSATYSRISIIEANNNVGIFRPSDTAVTIESESCFIFWFDTNSLPNHSYALGVRGVKLDDSAVSIPDIYFNQGELTDWRGVP